MLNELADRLESWVEAHRENEGTNAEGEVLSECGEFAVCNSEAILKALRFAADMERLKIREIWGPRYTGDVWTVFHLHGGRHLMSEGPDIYTAARKAVEELEKGEGDG